MDERTKSDARALRERTRSRTPRARATPVRGYASLPGRDVLRHYGCASMKDLKSRIVTFLLAIIVSLAAWGSVVYFALHFIKKHG